MSRSLSRMQAVVLGVLVLAGLGGGAFGLFQVGDRQRLWSGTFDVYVGFPRVQGVNIGTPVRVRGIEAGAVAGIELPASDRASDPVVLRMRLDRKYQHLLFTDAVAAILTEGMIGGRVIEIDPGTADRGSLADGSVIASRPTTDLGDVVKNAADLIGDARGGQGTVGKFLKDDKVYKEMADTLQQTKEMVKQSQEAANAIKQNADAIKKLPIVRRYVEDPVAILFRPTATQHRFWLKAADLFEPHRAVLTDAGKQQLDAVGPWLKDLRYKGSDVVVAAYADPATEPSADVAYTLTTKQAEVVTEYLKDRHGGHKLGWFKRRTVKPIGMGLRPPPVPNSQPMPSARVEVIVFVPE